MFCFSSPCNLPIVNRTEIGSWSLISSCNNPSSQVFNSVTIRCILFICDEILNVMGNVKGQILNVVCCYYNSILLPYYDSTVQISNCFRTFAIVLVALDSESKSSGYEQSLITIFGHQPGLVGNRHKKQ